MSIFVPFKAIRPLAAKAKEIACRPYDVLDTQEAREKSKDNPNSFYRVIKPELEFADEFDHYAPEIYQRGADNFKKLVASGMMTQDRTENFYVYRIIMGKHSQTGLVGCCSIDDYFNDHIKKHELTRPDKEEDRKNHVRYSKVNYEPVFFSYPQVTDLDTIVAEASKQVPLYDITTSDGIQHTLWSIENASVVAQIVKLFESKVPSIYVADGHHRTAAGALVAKELREASKGNSKDGKRYNYFMAVVFPDNQLKIQDYNRVVKDLNGHTYDSFLSELEKRFDVSPVEGQYRPEGLHHFGAYMNGQWYKLVAKAGSFNDRDPLGVLDVTILSSQVLEPLLNIVDLRTDKRIEFVGGIRGLEELERKVDSGQMKAAFAMYPVSMKQLIDIADGGLIMPPKVTWFEPKLRSGLFVHSLEN